MKKMSLVAVVALAGLASCDNDDRYMDLNTGERIVLVKDESTGLMVNETTKKPVYLYVDTKTNDTIYGRTGKVINGHIVRVGSEYKYDNDNVTVTTSSNSDGGDGDYKRKVEKDGDIKIKDGDTKIKIDGKTGEKKVKKD